MFCYLTELLLSGINVYKYIVLLADNLPFLSVIEIECNIYCLIILINDYVTDLVVFSLLMCNVPRVYLCIFVCSII